MSFPTTARRRAPASSKLQGVPTCSPQGASARLTSRTSQAPEGTLGARPQAQARMPGLEAVDRARALWAGRGQGPLPGSDLPVATQKQRARSRSRSSYGCKLHLSSLWAIPAPASLPPLVPTGLPQRAAPRPPLAQGAQGAQGVQACRSRLASALPVLLATIAEPSVPSRLPLSLLPSDPGPTRAQDRKRKEDFRAVLVCSEMARASEIFPPPVFRGDLRGSGLGWRRIAECGRVRALAPAGSSWVAFIRREASSESGQRGKADFREPRPSHDPLTRHCGCRSSFMLPQGRPIANAQKADENQTVTRTKPRRERPREPKKQ